MTTTRDSSHSSAKAAWSAGGVIFAATLLILGGVFAIFEGIGGLARSHNDIYVSAPNYTWHFSLTSWGWIHLIVGAIMVIAGLALFTGATWARYLGIVLASISLLTNFFFIPYYPLWTLAIMAIDVFIIWALATAPRAQAVAMEQARMDDARMAESRMDAPRREM